MGTSKPLNSNHVLDKSDSINSFGHLNFRLVVCLAIAWTLMFCFICKGVKSLGKVSYFTAIFPYIMITILLVRGASLDGAKNGILYYLKPEWNKLATIDVWTDAATQIFFSLSICTGGLITLSSYNPFKNNVLKDSVVITICNSLTSIYAGFAIFSIIGFMAYDLNKDIDKVVAGGPGLAFVAYPSALSLLPVSPLWSALFFFMLLLLGFGTEMTLVDALVTTIVDQWPKQLRHRKMWVVFGVCLIMFFAGLIMCTQSGVYILTLMDSYCLPYSALIIALCEVLAISWAYGIDRFMDNVKDMIDFYPKPHLYWKTVYQFVAPVMILVLLICKFIFMEPLTDGDYRFPVYTEVIGWLLCLSSVILIPIVAFYQIFRSEEPFVEAFRTLVEPTVSKRESNLNVNCGDKRSEDILLNQTK